MPILVVERTDTPKPWRNKLGGTMYSVNVHGNLDGSENQSGQMNVTKLENVPGFGDEIEVSVEETDYGLKFKKVMGGHYVKGGQTAPPTASHFDQDPFAGLVSVPLLTTRPVAKLGRSVQPVDVNAAMARAIEFVTKSPSFVGNSGDWMEVKRYTVAALDLQQDCLTEKIGE